MQFLSKLLPLSNFGMYIVYRITKLIKLEYYANREHGIT